MILRRMSYEFIGTMVLLIAVVGSSFMASYLKADWALGLLINAAVTAATLGIIIKVGASVSGAHFNPVVTLAHVLLRRIPITTALQYFLSQICGAAFGVIIANAMFSSTIIGNSSINRTGSGLFLAEIVATSGLVYLALTSTEKSVWKLIPLWIFAAYFFTSSTSFANPAVTLSRVLTDSPAGISNSSVPAFLLAQIVGALLALGFIKLEEKID